MAELPLPYLLLTQTIAIPGADQPTDLWICLNLIDHRATAVGLSREDAMERMIATTNSLNQSENAPAVSTPKRRVDCVNRKSDWRITGDALGQSPESAP